ncbi:MAG: MFS transporter [Gammaproteobacteria bacterium]|nr:MFS transporter [Gammaproteobacteria bacterium]
MSSSVWKHRGFNAYLLVAFLNAFTDLGHKIIIQNALFKYFDGTELRVYTAIIQAMILLPFVLTFTPAGWLADRWPKHLVIRYCALTALPITLLILLCYQLGAFWLAFGLTFLLALQSAFYSPAKFGYIRELVGMSKLASGNAAVYAVSLGAILAGTLVYTLLFEGLLQPGYESLGEILRSVKLAGFLLVGGAALECLFALGLPRREPVQRPEPLVLRRYLRTEYLRENLSRVFHHRAIWLSIVGLSIFFAVNQVILANFGAHLKEVMGETDTRVANGLMALGGVGIVLGSLVAGRVSRNYIETGLIPFGALGLAVCLLWLPGLESITSLALLMLALGGFGGLLVVPLNALIQYHAPEGHIGTVLAGRNFVENVAMLVMLALSGGLAWLAVSNAQIFTGLGLLVLIGFAYALRQLPQAFVRYIGGMLVGRGYRMEVVGLENLPANDGVLLLGNHVSWLDWAVLQIASPRPIRFVMARTIYDKWYLRWFLDLFGVIPITSSGSKDALQTVSQALRNGEVVALFPEGHISHTGHLSVFRSGFETAARGTDAVIVPFYLRGLWGSQFSYASPHFRDRSRDGATRIVTVGFGPALSANANAVDVKQAVLETSVHSWQQYVGRLQPLGSSFVRTAKACRRRLAVIDGETLLTYGKLLAAVLAFRRRLRSMLAGQQRVGILLPPSAGSVVANMASLMLGKTVVNLNYSADPEIVATCVERAGIKTILTSDRFLASLEKRGFVAGPLLRQARLVGMESIRKEISAVRMAGAFLAVLLLPTRILTGLYCRRVGMQDTAAILFSSGSEGVPKGVELSHANIVGNIKQIASVLNPTDEDVVLNTLPVFHAFGLTVTTFMPLIEGLPQVCQPDPTDARAVGRMVARYQVTMMFGAATFLRMYLRSRHVPPVMFDSLRLIVAGAERLTEEVRQGYREKFGKTVFEGYGTTETTPVACVNLQDVLLSWTGTVQVGHKSGTVGLPLPGARVRIVDPETLEDLAVDEAGLVLIGGTQIMKGYLDDPGKTAEVIVEQNGIRWYKSGDKGKLDEDGFLTILDRYARFAKLGGEMVSLSVVEDAIRQHCELPEEADLLAVALPDPGKGEQVVVLVSGVEEPEQFAPSLRAAEVSALLLPRRWFRVEQIPKLGSGKNDLAGAKKLARAQMAAASAG